MTKPTYLAVKIKGIDTTWFWFALKNVTEENGRFIGKGGWGKGGEFTNLDVDIETIEGRIESNALQYND